MTKEETNELAKKYNLKIFWGGHYVKLSPTLNILDTKNVDVGMESFIGHEEWALKHSSDLLYNNPCELPVYQKRQAEKEAIGLAELLKTKLISWILRKDKTLGYEDE